MRTKTEVERKYEVPAGFVLPELSGVAGVAAVGEPVEQRLEATYFDTPGLLLAARRVTLRRRTGGDDAGWHVKAPRPDIPDARTEFQLPLTPSGTGVPRKARQAVRDISGGQPLDAVATIRTRRLARPLRDRRGRVLAVLADDMVSASAVGDRAVLQNWRELEVELVDGPAGLLAKLDRALRGAGARPSATPSKLARTLADRYPAPGGDPEDQPLQVYASAQLSAIRTGEPAARDGDVDAVHDVRVAIRRLRSILRTFRALLDRERAQRVRDELHWLGGAFGDVRDGQVLTARLTAMVAAEPPELVVGPVVARMRSELAASTAQARERLVEALDSDRYRSLLIEVDALIDTELSGRPRPRRLRRAARAALHRADRRLDRASGADPAHRDGALHEARKACKRARYAVEAIRPQAGKPAHRLVKSLTALQDVLGDHQDTVVARELLRGLGMRAHLGGENGFSYGLLHARQQAAGERRLAGLGRARRAAGRRKVRRWLSA
jgi:CHAD domain-containing protein